MAKSACSREEAREALVRKAKARRQRDIRQARQDPAAFIEYAFRHEQTGRRLVNAAFHVDWQRALDEHPKVVLHAPVEHAKTQQISVGRVLWEIGRNPNIRVCVISDTAPQSRKVLAAIKTHIESNPRVREVFPHLKPSSRALDPWHKDAATVERQAIANDSTIQVCGAFGAINGSRVDLVVIDDICDFENTRTQDQRRKLLEWIDSTVLQRVTDGGRIWVIGTPWHIEDALHQLGERKGFVFRRYSAVLNPDDPHTKWIPLWPESWSQARLIDRYENSSTSAFERKILVRLRRDATARFKQLWIDRALQLGRGMTMQRTPPRARSAGFLQCFTGVDPAIGDKEQDALSVIFTFAVNERGQRIVLEIQSGRWTAPEIVERLKDVSARYGGLIGVESNAAQKYLVQWCEGEIPIQGLTTGANKHSEEWGVESMAVEMRKGMWVIPSGSSGKPTTEECSQWVRDQLNYDPSTHTSDYLMAWWVGRELARRWGAPMAQQFDAQAR